MGIPQNQRKNRILIGVLLLFAFYFVLLKSNGKKCISKSGNRGYEKTKYGIVLDAGSTGSRIHIYEFNFCGNELTKLNNEVFKQIEPGLSSFSNGKQAANSLVPLLNEALKFIPPKVHSITPISLKATAGLRLLSNELSADILSNIKKLFKSYPFQQADNSVSIIDGKDEGIYAWLTVNFLANRLTNQSKPAAIIEMGGGSFQVVSQNDKSPIPLYYEAFKFEAKNYNLYRHSYLGFGLMEARSRIVQRFFESQDHNIEDGFACLPLGRKIVFKKDDQEHLIEGNSSGWDHCKNIIGQIFNFNSECAIEPCSFQGIHQPELNSADKIYAFSFFYDRIFLLIFKDTFTLNVLEEKVKSICSVDLSQKIPSVEFLAVQNNISYCMDIGFLFLLLKDGLKIDPKKEITIAKKIDGIEIGWALGSSIASLQ